MTKKLPPELKKETSRGLGLIAERRSLLENGLTEQQKAHSLELVMEAIARILRHDAPEPTELAEYGDIHELTQVTSFAEFQERLLRANSAIHPAHRVLAYLVQLQCADISIRSLIGYLYSARRTIASALDNLKAMEFSILEAMGGEVPAVTIKDKWGQAWQAYTSALTPDSVVFRRAKTRTKKMKKAVHAIRKKNAKRLSKY